MSTSFWFATFQTPPTTRAAAGAFSDAVGPYFAIEALNQGNDWAVLISTVDNLVPTSATCLVGFTNVAKACNLWLDRGFPLVDADIRQGQPGELKIVSPRFVGDTSEMVYEKELFAISGIDLARQGTLSNSLQVTYNQFFQSPDPVEPDSLMARIPQAWRPTRGQVLALDSTTLPTVVFNFGAIAARCPSLGPLSEHPSIRPDHVWVGDIVVPDPPKPSLPSPPPTPQKVPPVFGTPAYRFEDVEILGFRIDLGDLDTDIVRRELTRLVAPLNFHLESNATSSGSGQATPEFRYRAATSTIVVELLRYGQMTSRDPQPPLRIGDSQSQHELVVRLLVGRVDEDGAQAYDPATFVPAIFVDNPWSKALGRDAIGYDKRLAAFYVEGSSGLVRLLPDGTRAGGSSSTRDACAAEPLGAVSHIKLVTRLGDDNGPPLMDFAYSSTVHQDPRALLPIDLDLTFGTSILAGARWRHTDFLLAEFRDSFAWRAVAEGLRSFRSIQAAPVGNRGGLDATWITGRFVLDPELRAALPLGTASLTFHPQRNLRHDSRPAAHVPWNRLCSLLAGLDPSSTVPNAAPVTVTVLPGSWYRLVCSMDLTIDNGVDWSPWVTVGRDIASILTG
jgi:hypothetical protein